MKSGGRVIRADKILALMLLLTLASCAATRPRQGDALSSAGPDNSNQGFGRSSLSNNGAPALPLVYLETKYERPAGKTITVRQGGDFQAALDAARPGDQIVLEAGSAWQGNFTLPKKDEKGDRWIVIRSSAPDSSMPQGARISPSQTNLMPKLLSPNNRAALRTASGAHHYRFIGIEFGIASEVKRISAIIALGDDKQATLDAVPRDIIFDRCYIHGNATANVRRGIALNSARTAVIDSYISDCHEAGADSQAVCGWAGPGPFKIVNNYLEAAGENLMFGGADPKIADLVPSDIEIRRNHFIKPLTWKKDHPEYAGGGWTVKNLFELKNARRVLVDGNIFEHNWAAAQTGYAILLKAANSSGRASWSVTEDVTFTNNIVRHSGAGLNILGRDYKDPSEQVKRIVIRNNLFYGIDKARWGGDGAFLKITDTADVTLDHNTVLQTGNIITAYGQPNGDFAFTNNLVVHNRYGVKGSSAGVGRETLEKFFPRLVFKKNAVVGGRGASYPEGNFFPATLAEVRFVDRAGGEHRTINVFILSAASPYRAAGTDGRAIGCDMEALKTAIGPLEKSYGASELTQKLDAATAKASAPFAAP